jgi:cytochrome c oxidase assembly protein subunit 15
VSATLAPWLRPLAWATLLANIVLVVTGGAVRLTGSGLGCPTWPRCTSSSFTPHGALDVHAAIEFGNRLLTFVLVAIAVATFISAWSSSRRDIRVLAFALALGIPAQAVIGGITVLTDLNPWVCRSTCCARWRSSGSRCCSCTGCPLRPSVLPGARWWCSHG